MKYIVLGWVLWYIYYYRLLAAKSSLKVHDAFNKFPNLFVQAVRIIIDS